MKKVTYAITILVIAVVTIAYYLFSQSASGLGKYDDFAKCITEKGIVVYGAYWCPHCLNQKNIFGSSWKYVDYVECDPKGINANLQLCQEKGISGYPTWDIGGRQYAGELTLSSLAKLSGCSLPK